MRKIKTHGSYLKSQTRKNAAKAALCIFLCAAIFLWTVPKLFLMNFDLFLEVELLVALIFLGAFYFYLHKYRIYSGGLEGEKRVSKLLNDTLSDEYFLINDAYFRDGGGDIDHILLGPNGLFAIETKNWSGKVTCNGDEWHRDNRHGKSDSASPSRQVKKNAARVRNVLESSKTLGGVRIWVEGVVVFANKHIDLQLSHPSVPILRLHELSDFIKSYRSSSSYSRQQLEIMGQEIVKQAR
jgi:hypothetical protein